MSKNITLKSNQQKVFNNYYMLPLLFALLVIPLFVRLHIYDSGLSRFKWFLDNNEEYDLFLYFKSRILVFTACVMAVLFIIKLFSDKFSYNLKKEIWLYFLVLYGVLTFLSTVFSDYRSFGFSGIYEQFESVWVILAYCMLTLYAFYFIRSDNDLSLLKLILFCLLSVLCIIGITQLVGHDIFETDFGKKIIIPEKYSDVRNLLKFNFSDDNGHQVYLTLYNPNYVGVFASLILPITVILIFLSDKIFKKAAWGIVSLILLLCTFGSGSKTFIISFAVIILVAVIFFRKGIIKHLKLIIPILLVILAAGGIYFSYIKLNPFQYVKKALTIEKNNYALEDIIFNEDNIAIKYNGSVLYASYYIYEDSVYFYFTDESGEYIDYYLNDNGYAILDTPLFSDIYFKLYTGIEDYPYTASAVINYAYVFFVDTEDGYKFVNGVGKFDEIVPAETAVFTNYDSLFSGRGYIWSRTLPLLKNHILLGSGADTFSIVFPHNDYMGRLKAGYGFTIITKPHSLYLQIGVQHGLLALLCFLAVCTIYLVQSFKLYFKRSLKNNRYFLGIGIMLGIIGYLVSGITNDSTVALAPVFWIILGTGFAVNKMNKAAH